MATLARAVHYAHEHGFLHCDLKPSNILMDREGRPHVTDFGLAKRTSEDSSLSVSGAILGTPSYMAPEQASGSRKGAEPGDRRLRPGRHPLRALDRRPPFRADTVMETVVQVLERDPRPSPRAAAGSSQRTGNDLPEVPGEVSAGSLPVGRRLWPRSSIAICRVR